MAIKGRHFSFDLTPGQIEEVRAQLTECDVCLLPFADFKSGWGFVGNLVIEHERCDFAILCDKCFKQSKAALCSVWDGLVKEKKGGE
jgi:hypothetical protein